MSSSSSSSSAGGGGRAVGGNADVPAASSKPAAGQPASGGERRPPDVVSVLTGAVRLMGEDVEKIVAFAQQKATEVTDVEAHMQKVGKTVAIVGNVAAAAADDAKKGAEAGISKGLDTAKNAADVGAHLEKAKQAAATAAEVAAAATDTAKQGGGGAKRGAVLGQSMHMAAPRVHVSLPPSLPLSLSLSAASDTCCVVWS